MLKCNPWHTRFILCTHNKEVKIKQGGNYYTIIYTFSLIMDWQFITRNAKVQLLAGIFYSVDAK